MTETRIELYEGPLDGLVVEPPFTVDVPVPSVWLPIARPCPGHPPAGDEPCGNDVVRYDLDPVRCNGTTRLAYRFVASPDR